MLRVLLAALLAAAPAVAQSEEWDPQSSLRGLYAAIGGGGSWMFVPGDDDIGYDVELRLGYSFSPALQAYVSGALDGAAFSGATFRSEQIAAFIQYHFLVRQAWMLYGRLGIGVGLSGDLAPDATATGFAEAAGFGVEIRIAPNLLLAPEVLYRNTKLSVDQTDRRVQTVALQLNLVYY
jgi:hypothetical protein